LFFFLPKIVSKDLDGNIKELINENGILKKINLGVFLQVIKTILIRDF